MFYALLNLLKMHDLKKIITFPRKPKKGFTVNRYFLINLYGGFRRSKSNVLHKH